MDDAAAEQHGADLEGLARNWRDSLAHALSHFSDLRSADYGFHNRKWIVLSVSHAAEVFCNYLLKRADPSHPRGDYPSLGRALRMLREHKAWKTLSPAEQEAISEYLPPLRDMRNALMHGPAPEKVDVSEGAFAVLALLILVKRLTGLPTEEFFDQSPPIEIDVLDELRVKQLDRYTRFVERVVREEVGEGDDPLSFVRSCDNCGGETVMPLERECRACFHANRWEDDD